MSVKVILYAVLVLGGLGIIFAAFLSYASRVFHVKVDRRVAAVREALPGANCGACGFPGCDGLAEEIALRDGAVDGCPVGGQAVAEVIAEIMGKTAVEGAKNVACVMCQGDETRAKNRFNYNGITSCNAANALHGGQKACTYGCLGLGDCKDACAFGAITVENGLAIIDKDKCTSCGLCIEACPKGIIELIPYDQDVIVKCKSHDKPKDVRGKCSVGCLGCQICVRQSEPGAFSFDNFLARREFESGADPTAGLEKCPTKAIYPGLELKAKADAEKAAAKAKAAKNKPAEKVAEKAEDVKEKAEKTKKNVEEKANNVKEDVEEKAHEAKEEAKDKLEDAKKEAKKVKENVEEKTHEVKEEAKDKVEDAKKETTKVKEDVKEKAHEVKEEAEEKLEDAKEEVEEKVKEKKENMK